MEANVQPLFQESKAEREAREAFYSTGSRLDGQVIAAGEGEIAVGFAKHVTKDAVIIERVHKVKLD